MIFPIKTKIAFLGVSQFSDTPESVQSACFETTSQHVVATCAEGQTQRGKSR
jgi:hypothetical protein